MSDAIITLCNLGNCPRIRVNPDGSVTLWDSARPKETATFSAADWAALIGNIKNGDLDSTLIEPAA